MQTFIKAKSDGQTNIDFYLAVRTQKITEYHIRAKLLFIRHKKLQNRIQIMDILLN